MRAAILRGNRTVEVEDQPLPNPSPGQVRIRLEGCGVCASYLPVWEGRPWFSYPFDPGAPGHEGWGVVDEVAPGVTNIRPGERVAFLSNRAYAAMKVADEAAPMAPAVQEKSFDEFHLYTLQRPTTLRDQETKQVEFVRATGIHAQRLYIYDGAKTDMYGYYNPDQIRNDQSYGTVSNPKVWVMEEFKNADTNHLGIALPKGKLRFYRRDTDGHLEFTGENTIDHTPKDEVIRVYTGNAFDVVGERKRTNYHLDSRNNWMDESFEIRVRNHKKEAVNVRVVEHLYRWTNWKLTDQSASSRKMNAQTVEFPITIAPDGEQVVTYTVHYSW